MSFEGYYQVRCSGSPAHYYEVDCYSHSYQDKCQYCNSDLTSRLVDTTNGDCDHDPEFSNGCDRLVTSWESDLESLRDRLRTNAESVISAFRENRKIHISEFEEAVKALELLGLSKP